MKYTKFKINGKKKKMAVVIVPQKKKKPEQIKSQK